MRDPGAGLRNTRKVKVVARPRKGAGGVATPVRDKRTAPPPRYLGPEARPLGPTLSSRARTTPIRPGEQPMGLGLFGRVKYYGKPDTSTGFDPETHLSPNDLAKAEQIRRQNLGGVAATARDLLDAATGYTPLEHAIHSGNKKKLAGELAIQALFATPPGKVLKGVDEAARLAKAAADLGPMAKTARSLKVTKTLTRDVLSPDHGRALKRLSTTVQNVHRLEKIGADEKVLAAAKEKVAEARTGELYTRLHAISEAAPVDVTDPRFPARQALAEDLVRGYKKRGTALPPAAKRPADLQHLMSFLDELTTKGEHGRLWYEDSARAILDLAQGDKQKAERFAQLLAIYSPQQPILGNTSLAIRAWNQFESAADEYARTGKVATGQKWQREAAARVLSGKGDWNGRKTNNFYVNFLEDIDPDKFRELGFRGDEVTSDLWMARAFGFPRDEVSGGRYDVIENVVRQLAAERGWKPKQVQAAIWTAIKDASDEASANIAFDEGIRRHLAQFSYEAAPGTEIPGPLQDAYRTWDPAVQRAYLQSHMQLVDDFLKDAGFLSRKGFEGPGVYEGPKGVEFNPGAGAEVAVSAAPSGTKYALHPVERQRLDIAAAAIGRALKQNSVAWTRPFKATAISHVDAFALQLGRPATDEEAKALWTALNPGGTERLGVMHTRDGLMIRNFGGFSGKVAAKKGESYQSIVNDAVDSVFGPKTRVEWFATDGNLVEHTDYERLLDGGVQAGDGSGSGRDLRLRAAAHRLADSADALQRQFLERGADPGFAGRLRALLADESGSVTPGAFLPDRSGPYQPRTLAHNELEAQLPKSRSRITQQLERVVDKASTKLQASEFVRDLPGMRVVTAGERVAKAAGRSQKIEQARRQARMLEDLHAIGSVKEGSPDDVANFWYAQLPESHRNAEGLRLVRGKQAEELDYITSGRALEDLTSREGAVKAAMVEAETNGEAMRHLRELEEIKVLKTDLPQRADDVSASLAQLDELIANPPAANETAIRAVDSLMRDRERILIEAGRLNPERSEARRGLVSRWLGLEAPIPPDHVRLYRGEPVRPTPPPAHDRVARADYALRYPVEPKRGSYFTPDRRIAENFANNANNGYDGQLLYVDVPKSSLANEGRNSQYVLSDSLKSEAKPIAFGSGEESYIGHRLPRPESFRGSFMPSGGTGRVKSPQGLGRENKLVLARTGRLRASLRVAAEDWNSAQVFEQANIARSDLAKMGRPFEGFMPEGHVLVNPKGRTIPAHWKTDELAQFSEGYDDVEDIREKAKEILDGFIATDRASFEQMKQEALEQGVSWSELRVVPKRLVDRYYAQFRASRSRGTAAKLYDSLVDAVATSIVFARIGYIPKNLAQNLIMAVPHQGAFLLVNATRAGQVMADARLRHLIHAEIGFTGPTGAVSQEAFTHRIVGAAAGAVSKVADDPMRIAAFLHEAAAEGVISRIHPLLSERDRDALLRLLTAKSERTRLNDIRSRAVEAMADFSRMTPDQARQARRVLIIPGWLMAGSRYPFHFAANHPIRSALLAYIALGEPGAPDNLQFNQRIDRYFEGTSYRRGVKVGDKRLRTGSLNPVSTPWELGLAAVQTARGKEEHDFEHETAFDFANPLLATGIGVAQGEGVGSLEHLAPNYSFAEAIAHPQESKTYPQDASRLGRFERELGVVPIKVNDPAQPLTAEQKEQAKLDPVRKALGSVPPEVAAAEHTKTLYHDAQLQLRHENGAKQLSEREQVKLKLRILEGEQPELADVVAQLRATVDENETPEVYAAVDRWVEKQLGWTTAERVEQASKKLEASRG